MLITKPTLLDIDKMQELVREEVEKGVILARSSDEMATNIRSYFIAKDGENIVGFTALHIHTKELAEIRSLIVDKNKRGLNIGSLMVLQALEEGKRLNVKKVFALTYVKDFFEKLQFSVIPKESLPENKIWLDCIKCKHFPICDEIALLRDIS